MKLIYKNKSVKLHEHGNIYTILYSIWKGTCFWPVATGTLWPLVTGAVCHWSYGIVGHCARWPLVMSPANIIIAILQLRTGPNRSAIVLGHPFLLKCLIVTIQYIPNQYFVLSLTKYAYNLYWSFSLKCWNCISYNNWDSKDTFGKCFFLIRK